MPEIVRAKKQHYLCIRKSDVRPCSLFSVHISINSMTETQDIDKIVRKCQSGDRDALGILYQTYLDPMRKVVSYYIKNKEVVSDILHDGFLIAFVSISSLRNTSKVSAWLTSIMKNLALQYLKEEMNYDYAPLSEEVEDYSINNPESDKTMLSWTELRDILDQLPGGYGKIFRLAVLDGLSHKEIGELLGIAPHSSSSQLTHAKAMLRRLIKEYRMQMGLLSLLALIVIIWLIMPAHEDAKQSRSVISNNDDSNHNILPDSATATDDTDSVGVSPTIYEILRSRKTQDSELVAKALIQNDTIPSAPKDSISEDDVHPVIRLNDWDSPIAEQKATVQQHSLNPDWSLSLAYSGISGQDNANRYRIPDPTHPDLPSGEPDAEIEVSEKSHHKMPVIIGLSLNKALTSRWSIETGLRYSFMESDFLSESKLWEQRVNQQIHYIGVPLKFNYHIFSAGRFSLYGHGGGALDIPVSGRQSVWKSSFDMPVPQTDKFNIHVPLQWSVEGGLGIQYHFTPSFSIFAEPSIHYYFNPGGEIKTIRQEKPFEFTLPIGLRFTL